MKLKNGTVLEVGKKYVHATWLKDEVYEVTAIGETIFVYKPKDCDYELTHEIDNDWIPYEEPKTEKWVEYLNRRGNGDFYHKCYIKLRDIEELDSYDTIIIREWDSKEEMINDLRNAVSMQMELTEANTSTWGVQPPPSLGLDLTKMDKNENL